MVDETISIQVDDSEIDTTIAKIEGALDKKGEVEEVTMSAAEGNAQIADLKKQADEVGGGEGVKGVNLLVRRTVAQLPGVREGYRLTMLMRMLINNSPYIGAIIVAWMSGMRFVDWLQGGMKAAEAYRKLIMEEKGFVSRKEYDAYLADDNRKSEAFRSAVPT